MAACCKMVANRQVSCSDGQWRMGGSLMVAMILMMGWMSAANAQDATAPASSGPVNGPAGDVVPVKGNPCSVVWFQAHGWFMWVAFAICFPLGVCVSRFGQNYFSQWFHTHIFLQVTGLIFATIAFAVAAIKFPSSWDGTHSKLGMAIMCLVWLQPLMTNIRPHRGTAMRPAWYFLHWLIGTAAIVLGWFNTFKGLDAYVYSWPSGGQRKLWYVLWACNLAVLAFLYLFFDRLPYIRAQAKDHGAINPGNLSRSDKEYNINTHRYNIASDVETSFNKPDMPIVDNEPRQWIPV